MLQRRSLGGSVVAVVMRRLSRRPVRARAGQGRRIDSRAGGVGFRRVRRRHAGGFTAQRVPDRRFPPLSLSWNSAYASWRSGGRCGRRGAAAAFETAAERLGAGLDPLSFRVSAALSGIQRLSWARVDGSVRHWRGPCSRASSCTASRATGARGGIFRNSTSGARPARVSLPRGSTAHPPALCARIIALHYARITACS